MVKQQTENSTETSLIIHFLCYGSDILRKNCYLFIEMRLIYIRNNSIPCQQQLVPGQDYIEKGVGRGFKFMSSDTNSSHLSESFRVFFVYLRFGLSERLRLY